MKLFKDGIVMNVESKFDQERLRNLGYKAEGEEDPESEIKKLKDENQKLLKQIERYKNKL